MGEFWKALIEWLIPEKKPDVDVWWKRILYLFAVIIFFEYMW